MNRYPLWKYLLVAVALVVGVLYTLPNLYGTQPAIQVTRASGQPVDPSLVQRVRGALTKNNLDVAAVKYKKNRVVALFHSSSTQLKAAEAVQNTLGDRYIVALSLAEQTPAWLTSIGAEPMSLGLGLRGGVHFLLAVDLETLFNKRYEQYARDLAEFLREQSISYQRARQVEQGVKIRFADSETLAKARDALAGQYRSLEFQPAPGTSNALIASYTQQKRLEIVDAVIETNLSTLRNRVGELGVSEAVVRRQGRSNIVVKLPGVQNTARAKRLLGKTATLEYRLVAENKNARKAAKTGNIPPGADLFKTGEGRPVLLKEDVIVSGDELVSASAGRDQRTGEPNVQVTLSGQAADKMFQVTSAHVGDPMAVLYTETKLDTVYKNGERVTKREKIQKVVSIATIQSAFGKRFVTTGLNPQQAKDLALLLRAGSLAAPVQIIQQRTVGPSLGAENIKHGTQAVIIAFLLVVVFMAIYYRVFGLIADAALFMNLVLIVAALSILQATLTLPGIAGIVLTIGMAVDANVLIFERIREELRTGASTQTAIKNGYDRAFSSIADGQVTTLIAALVLFAFGSGPVRGFAVTLSIGIFASLFTSIIATRALVNLIYGRRKRATALPI